MAALAAGSMTVAASIGPAVTTDRATYPAGDEVEIAATGFAPNEPVTIQVTHDNGTAEPGMGHEPWIVDADASGAISTAWSIDLGDVTGPGFLVTATGNVSGAGQSPAFVRKAAVETERQGYPADVAIAVAGRGFTPGETVTLQVTHADGTAEAANGHEEWTAVAGPGGMLSTTWAIRSADTSGDDFVVSAIGDSSGAATSAAFKRTGVVVTDKVDYQPGEIAVVSGAGFGPNEDVVLQIVHSDGKVDGNGHAPFVAPTDPDGRFSTTWYVDPDDSLGSKFLLSARGAASARTANAVFYDAGTVSLTALNVAFTETFDSLANTGTANTALPTGWALSEAGSSTRNNGQYAAGTGSDNTGDTYSYGASGSTERAFGGLLSGTLNPTVGALFTNNTGGTIQTLAISYVGEMWRAGVTNRGAADRLDFQYSLDATALNNGTWTNVDALDFSSPNLAATAGALNGNAAANRTATSTVITGLDIANGATFAIRWTDFDITSSDDGLSVDDFSITANGLAADSAPTVASTTPANGATTVAPDSTVTVVFSEPVDVTGAWFALSCSISGAHAATVSGGPTSFVLGPTAPFVNGDACTLTVTGANVADQDANDPPDTMAANFVLGFSVVDVCSLPFSSIPSIQGSGPATAVTGTVTTQGVVVADYEGPSPALRGFYIQDPAGDNDPATSDGIFVFEGSNANTVAVGDIVRVTGTAGENQGQSQISVGTIARCGTGTVAPTDVTFPVATADFLERYEGMLVRLPQAMYVTEHFQLGRFGQVVLSSGDRLKQPTNIVPPGAPAAAVQAANDLNRIILDDDTQTQNPDPIRLARGGQPLSAGNTLRGGDSATGIVGVMTYTWAGNSASGNAYRVRPFGALGGSADFQPTNPRPASAPNVAGTLRVVSMNTLNFFNTFDGLPDTVDNCSLGLGGLPTDCRGADTQAEFDRQWPKTVAAILAMSPDVLAVNEMENDGYGPSSALAFLTAQLNAATAPGTYIYIDADANTGQVNAMGTDAIKTALLYKPAVVSPVGQTAVLNTVTFVNGGDSGPRNRPSIAQAFQVNATGARFIVDANHLKSKGSACDVPDQNDGQDNCAIVRTNAATELAAWLATDPTGTGDPDILILGDMNSYAQEHPITALKAAGFTNLIETFLGPDAYSYVFDGQWGYLDHALGSASILGQVSGVGDYHVNSDEPSVLDYNTDFKTANLQATLYAPDRFRVSDHDPVIVGLTPNAPPTVGAGGPYSVNEGGSVTLVANGADPNGDPLTYAWDLDNDGTFETAGQSATFDASTIDGPASKTVAVKATDPSGLAAIGQTTVSVANVAPTVGTPTIVPEPSVEGAAVVASASFTDPASADTFTCTVDYGDGSGALAGTVAGTTCTGPSHAYPAYGTYPVTVRVSDDDGGTGAAATSHTVIFDWSGFFDPVSDPPAINTVKAGKAIPVKFSLGGFKGLSIFATGYPRVVLVACSGVDNGEVLDEVDTAGNSPLTYDVESRRYILAWKTDKAWANSCRELQVKLVDGTVHVARFRFKK